jgi:hypothetical protein
VSSTPESQSDGGDPVTTGLLTAIQRAISGAEEALWKLLRLAKHALYSRHSDTGRDAHPRTIAAKRLLGDLFAQRSADEERLVETSLRHYNREFLATEPRYPVSSAAQALLYALRTLPQHGVPCGVSVLVIDTFEIVYVTHGNRDGMPETRSPQDLPRIVNREEPPVGDTGEFIGRGKAAAFDERRA